MRSLKTFLPVAMIVIASLALTDAAMAQATATQSSGTQNQSEEGVTEGTNASSTRIRRTRNGSRTRVQAPSAPSPAEVLAAAQAVVASTSTACEVTEATMLGVNAEQKPIYEAACSTGPGYVLIASTPPQAVDCVVLAGQADLDRSRDPSADVGIQCKLPINTDVARVIGGYAQQAGITCTVDQGASIGKSSEGHFIYEVGCSDADGFWIEKAPAGWEKTTCLQIVTQSAACRFTQPAEQAATVKAMLVGSPAAACDVTEARYMGGNANGTFYEAKCGSGDGLIARFNAEQVVQQIYPCAEAARIGGGCKLTTVAAAPAATPAPAPATN